MADKWKEWLKKKPEANKEETEPSIWDKWSDTKEENLQRIQEGFLGEDEESLRKKAKEEALRKYLGK